MKWVTRERPKIDRIACPWLIERFIDKAPEFLFVPSTDVFQVAEEKGAIPYDIPGVELSHEGERCSFDAFLGKYRLTDAALATLAVISVARIPPGWIWRPKRRDCSPFRWGCRKTSKDNREMLKHGMVMYDALYAWCNTCQSEAHSWPPKLQSREVF